MKSRRFFAGAMLILLVGAPEVPASHYVSTDIPTALGTATYQPSQVARRDGTSYSLALDLPDEIAVDALHRMDGGDWLFSAEAPFTIGQSTFDPRDVVRLSGGAYSLYFDGDAAGIPDGANVDAIFLSGGDHGTLILSLDVPATIGNLAIEPADLVEVLGAGSFQLLFDASAAANPIPASVNVVAADGLDSRLILSLDVPTTLGGTVYLPGDLVSWDGMVFTLYSRDSAWPAGSTSGSMAFLAAPGQVLASLRVARVAAAPALIELSWGPSCSSGAETYGIHEGVLGVWYSHTAIDCTDDGGDLRETIQPGSGNRYYIVAPRNANDEGSLGQSSSGVERPRGQRRCAATQRLSPCP